jgi:LPXTG-motif cell wall-anchored protein
MRAGLMIRRMFAALLLSGVLLVAGASMASADDGYGTYPVPEAPPAQPDQPDTPSALPRTGSNTGTLVAAGAGALALGGGLLVVSKRRQLAVSAA